MWFRDVFHWIFNARFIDDDAELAGSIPNAALAVIDGAAHSVPM